MSKPYVKLHSGAAAYVNTVQPRFVLIDGLQLANLIIEYDVAVSTETNYAVKRLDLDYFADGGSIALEPVVAHLDPAH